EDVFSTSVHISLSSLTSSSVSLECLFYPSDPSPPDIYTLSLHDALPILPRNPNVCCIQLYSGVTTVDVAMLGLALNATFNRNPVIAVASGSRVVLQPPASSGVASLLQRCRKTTCNRGG